MFSSPVVSVLTERGHAAEYKQAARSSTCRHANFNFQVITRHDLGTQKRVGQSQFGRTNDLLDVVSKDRFKQILKAIWQFKVMVGPITSQPSDFTCKNKTGVEF